MLKFFCKIEEHCTVILSENLRSQKSHLLPILRILFSATCGGELLRDSGIWNLEFINVTIGVIIAHNGEYRVGGGQWCGGTMKNKQ